MLDYQKLASEWIRQMRGNRSQPQLSRMLGFDSNVVHTWEAGRRYPTAETFLKLLIINNVDLSSFWGAFFSSAPDWEHEEGPEAIAEFLRLLKGDTPILVIADKTGFSRFAVSRWLRCQSEPRLPDFFRIVESMSLRLLDLLSLTTDVRKIGSARDAWEKLERARNIAIDLPWSHAVLRVLELEDYQGQHKHNESWVAKKLGVTIDIVRECIEALADTGQIRKVGKHWVADAVLAVDTRGKAGGKHALKSWWTQVGLERLPESENGQFSYNLFTVSEVDFEKIRALHLAYFRAMRAIVADSEPAEKVAVVNLHLFDLAD